MKHFLKFSETIFTPKEWFLSKKGLKEGERVARGHFHERVGETPVHWLPPSVGITKKPFSVFKNAPFENYLRSNSIFMLFSWSVKAHISYQSVRWRLTAVKDKREQMPLAEITQFSVFTTGESLGA